MRYWYSAIGEEQYKKIDLPYPKHPFDNAYDSFKKKTASSQDNQFIINRLIRIKIPETEDQDKEYILYDLQEIRKDGMGNPKSFTRTNLGLYPIPQRTAIRAFDEDGQPIVKTGGISEINDGYEFLFTPEKADELHKLGCVDKFTLARRNKTQYLVEKLGEYTISVNSFKDWRDGDFETLYYSGNAEGILPEEQKPKSVKKSKTQQEKEEKVEMQLAQYKKNYTVTKP